MVLGDAVSKIGYLSMDFEPYFKVHNLVSVHLKSIIRTWSNNQSQHDLSCGGFSQFIDYLLGLIGA